MRGLLLLSFSAIPLFCLFLPEEVSSTHSSVCFPPLLTTISFWTPVIITFIALTPIFPFLLLFVLLLLLLFLFFLCLDRHLFYREKVIFVATLFISRYGFGSTALHEQLLLVLIKLLQVLGQLVGVHMINSDQLSEHLHPVQVVNSQHCAALVHIAEEPEASALAACVVSNQVDMDNLAILGEHADYVPLGHLIGQATKEDPGGIFVLLMPGVLRPCHSCGKFPFVHFQLIVRLRFRIHDGADAVDWSEIGDL